MRTITAGLRALMASGRFWFTGRVELTDQNGMWQDMTAYLGVNWFESATWTENVDQPVSTGTVTLTREHAGVSLAAAVGGSPANHVGGVYSPLLREGRGVRLSSAITPAGTRPLVTDYHECFIGTYDSHESTSEANTITLQIRDLGARVVDAMIRKPKTYAPSITTGTTDPTVTPSPDGELVETVVQDILADALGAGAVELYTPVPTGTKVANIDVPIKSALEAVRDVALLIGWDIRYRYDAAGVSRLTLSQPARVAAPGAELAWFAANEYLTVPRLDTSIVDVRNVVRVDFTNADTTGLADHYEARDETSIAAYGQERWMNLSFAATSNINTLGEAQRLADAAVADMAFPLSDHDVLVFPLYWPVQLGDYYGFRANGTLYDADQSFGVFGFTHTMENAGGTTQLVTKGRVVGAFREWQRRSTSEAGTATTQVTADPRALALKNFREVRRTPTEVTYGWDALAVDVAEVWTWGKLSDQSPDPPLPAGANEDRLWRDIVNDPPDGVLDRTTTEFAIAIPPFGKIQTWELQPVDAKHTRGYSQRVKTLATPDVPRITSMTAAGGLTDLETNITALNVVDPQALGGVLSVWLNHASPDDADPNAAPDGTLTMPLTPRTVTNTDAFDVLGGTATLFESVRVHPGAGKRVYFEFTNSSGISSGLVAFVLLGTGGVIDSTGQLKDDSINRAQQVANAYALPSVYDTLPSTGRANELAVLTTDNNRLFRWNGSQWTAEVRAPDLSGVLTAGQLAAHIIDISKVATSLAPPEVFATLPASPGTNRTALVGGVLYRSTTDGTGWTATVDTSLLGGQITSTQIGPGAVDTPQLHANAVTATTIAGGAVIAGKIDTNAVTAGTVAAGAINTTQLVAGAVTAGILGANAVIAGKIDTGAVTAGTIAAGAVTTATMTAGTITGDRISTNTLDASAIIVGSITGTYIHSGAIDTSKISTLVVSEVTPGVGVIQIGRLRSFDGQRYLDLNATGTLAFLQHPQFTLFGNGNATFSGALSAATGSFSGSLSAATGSFSGTLNAVSGTFGTITAGRLQNPSNTAFIQLDAASGAFLSHPALTLNVNGTATFGGTVSSSSFSAGLISVTGSDARVDFPNLSVSGGGITWGGSSNTSILAAFFGGIVGFGVVLKSAGFIQHVATAGSYVSLMIGSTESGRFDVPANTDDIGLFVLHKTASGTVLKRIGVDVADSGGSGWRRMRVQN